MNKGRVLENHVRCHILFLVYKALRINPGQKLQTGREGGRKRGGQTLTLTAKTEI